MSGDDGQDAGGAAVLRAQAGGGFHFRRTLAVVAGVGLLVVAIVAAWLVIQDVVGSSPQSIEDLEFDRRVVRDEVASAIDSHIGNVMAAAKAVAKSPRLVALLAARSAAPFNASEVAAIDRQWRGAEVGNAVIAPVEQSDVSAFLREFVGGDRPLFREVFAADKYGRLVGMSNKTEDYDQGDADDAWWWPASERTNFPDGCKVSAPSCVRIFDVEEDRSAKQRCWFLILPVADGGVVHGVLKVAVDVSGLAGLESLARVRRRFEVRLVNAEGRSLADPNAAVVADIARIDGAPLPGNAWEARDSRLYIRALGEPVFSRSRPAQPSSWLVVVRDADGAAPIAVVGTMHTAILILAFMASALILAGLAVALSKAPELLVKLRHPVRFMRGG